MCDLNRVVAQCAKVAVQGIRSGVVELEISLNETIGEVATDASLVSQILDNLLTNAIDALGEKGGGVIVSTAGTRIVSSHVADTGPDSPRCSRAFDPFLAPKVPAGYGLDWHLFNSGRVSGGLLSVESKGGR